MPYTINKTDGVAITTVADGTVDSTTSLKLIGKNYAGYGEIQNENFLFLLENFAYGSPPGRALAGQLWFDTLNGKLKFNDGSKWRTTGGAETGTIQPTGLTVGDFWWDTQNKQLYASNGDTTFTLVGPQGVAGSATTQMRSRSIKEAGSGTSHAIIEAVVNGQTIFTISPDSAFTLDTNTTIPPLTGFTKIQQGVTLAYTNNESQPGQTTDSHRFWGTATNADRLGGYDASAYLRTNNAIFNTLVQFADVGFTVGTNPRLRVFNSGGDTPIIQNQLSDTIVFQTTVNSSTKIPLQLVGTDLKPGSDNTNNIGASNSRFKTVYAYSFDGTATQADKLALGSGYTTASAAAGTVGTIVARTSTDEIYNGTTITAGAIKATYFIGTATAANYADLAEKYLADADYEIGTVVSVGGEKEVTASTVGDRALGAVSANPAFMMNQELEGGTYIALKGRVPVKVSGLVSKGQRLVAGANGTAQAAMGNTADVFAIALESNSDIGIKLVECVIL